MLLDRHFIEKILPHALITGPSVSNMNFVLDSRVVQPGDCFVALAGAQVDGHDYLHDALVRGARAFIIDKQKSHKLSQLGANLQACMVMQVDDCEKSLIDLARAWRKQWSIPVIGITGSVGKTSTKELLYETLRAAGKKVLASSGNQNTAIGISINILKITHEHDVAIFEMGINKRGEMTVLADLVRPTIGLITMIGHSHMEGLGSLSDIATEKRDIFKYFKEDNIGIVNGDQQILSSVAYAHPIVRFGIKMSNQIQARKILMCDTHIECTLKIYDQKYTVSIPTNHLARIQHILAVSAITHLLDIPTTVVIEQLQKPFVVKSRFEKRILKQGKGNLIDDCYNANPESIKAALLAFNQIESSRKKIAVLGDMLELGMNSSFWHRQLGRFLKKYPTIQTVIFVGNNSQAAKKTVPDTINTHFVASWQDALPLLEQEFSQKPVDILIKGSRGMKLQELVKELCE